LPANSFQPSDRGKSRVRDLLAEAIAQHVTVFRDRFTHSLQVILSTARGGQVRGTASVVNAILLLNFFP
jgi:hypothetical protein